MSIHIEVLTDDAVQDKTMISNTSPWENDWLFYSDSRSNHGTCPNTNIGAKLENSKNFHGEMMHIQSQGTTMKWNTVRTKNLQLQLDAQMLMDASGHHLLCCNAFHLGHLLSGCLLTYGKYYTITTSVYSAWSRLQVHYSYSIQTNLNADLWGDLIWYKCK